MLHTMGHIKIYKDIMGFQSLKLWSQYSIEIYLKKLVEKAKLTLKISNTICMTEKWHVAI